MSAAHKRPRYYVGLGPAGERIAFRSARAPTRASHGALFAAVIGPFSSRRGAVYMTIYGRGNPHCRCVADAERLARSLLK